MYKFDFKEKVILITGGSSGIGLETAKILAKLGAKVIITCKTKTNFEKFKTHYRKSLSEKFLIERLDLTNEISIDSLCNKIEKLDILINNASFIKGGIEYRVENFADIVNVNLMGLMRICHAMLPKLAISNGNIVNVSSANTRLALATSPAYSATKGGINTLTKSMAACWAQHNVRVNAVAPGWIAGRTLNVLKKDIEKFQHYKQRIPLKRLGKPEEVANTIVFLASEKASYISGSTIFVDGGYTIN